MRIIIIVACPHDIHEFLKCVAALRFPRNVGRQIAGKDIGPSRKCGEIHSTAQIGCWIHGTRGVDADKGRVLYIFGAIIGAVMAPVAVSLCIDNIAANSNERRTCSCSTFSVRSRLVIPLCTCS